MGHTEGCPCMLALWLLRGGGGGGVVVVDWGYALSQPQPPNPPRKMLDSLRLHLVQSDRIDIHKTLILASKQ